MRLTRIIPVALALAAAITATSSATASTRSEHFSLVTTSTSPSNHVFSAIATGAFTAGGTARISGGTAAMRFSAGTITLALTARHTRTTNTDCVQTKRIDGAYRITGGTGAYAGMHGSGTLAFKVTIVEGSSNGTCSATLAAAQGVLTANGAVS